MAKHSSAWRRKGKAEHSFVQRSDAKARLGIVMFGAAKAEQREGAARYGQGKAERR